MRSSGYDLWRLKTLGFSHGSARPKAYNQNAEAMDAFKKFAERVSESPCAARTRHTGRGLVPTSRAAATKIAPGAHAIVLLDQAGAAERQGPQSSRQRPALAAPATRTELKGQENIWQFMRRTWLSNRLFKSFDESALIDRPWKIMSIAGRDWAAAVHSMRIGISYGVPPTPGQSLNC
jgi:hypothetical protein